MTLLTETLPLTHELVAAHLQERVGDKIVIHPSCRIKWGTNFLTLHRNKGGYFVLQRPGRRGGLTGVEKILRLDACEVTYFDGKPMLFRFKLKEECR